MLRTVLGKTIKNVEVRLPKIIALGPKTVSNFRKSSGDTVKIFKKLLKGQKIVAIKRRAKMLIIQVSSLPRRGEGSRERSKQRKNLQPLSYSPLASSDVTSGARGEGKLSLLIHLKMTGQLIFARKGESKLIKIMNIKNARVLKLPHQYTHVILEFADGSRLFYNDMRQFGYLRLVRDEDVPKVKELAEYGPEPLTADFTFEYLLNKAKRRPDLSVKQFLCDPKVIAGIGNIYSDEILYWAKVRPNRKVSSIRYQELGKIYENIKKVLKAAIAAQGSSVGDFFKVDATEGRYGLVHRVYGRAGEKCKRCGSIIQSVKLGGRTASYCPKCQK